MIIRTPVGLLIRLFAALSVILVLGLGACGGEPGQDTCTSDAECFSGYACDITGTQTCWRSCTSDAQCLASQDCNIPPNQSKGFCRAPEAN